MVTRERDANLRSHASELLRFALVGLFNSGVDFSVFWICARTLLLPLLAANFIAWAVAFSISFVINNYWTFRRHRSAFLHLSFFLRVAIGNLLSWGVATGVLIFAAHQLPLAAAKLLSIAVGFVLNFCIGKFMPLPMV